MIKRYAKAVVAAVTAGGGALGTALADDAVTTNEWLVAALAVLAALGITATVPNRQEETGPTRF